MESKICLKLNLWIFIIMVLPGKGCLEKDVVGDKKQLGFHETYLRCVRMCNTNFSCNDIPEVARRCYRLRENYEEQDSISLPRGALYSHYLDFCQEANLEPMNQASLGKVIRSIFPDVKTRRLGTRGQSK